MTLGLSVSASKAQASRLRPNDPNIPHLHNLLQRSFAYMEGRIDPPSSLHRLTKALISEHCETGEVWAIGDPPIACVFLTPKPECLYVGKLAVDHAMRGQGLARQLIEVAEVRARALELPRLELNARIELSENHKTFAALGFKKHAERCHRGFTRTTFISMRKPVTAT